MRERETKVSNPLTGGGSNRGQSPPAPRPRKKGGNAWNSDREGLGWPPSELALLFILPKHQSTTIPPFLRKAKGRKARREENNMKARDIKRGYHLTRGGSNREQASQTPRLREKGGNAWNNDREGLGWPPRVLALLIVLPQHQQFQALFNSLFKVLFIFPSQYLFAVSRPYLALDGEVVTRLP